MASTEKTKRSLAKQCPQCSQALPEGERPSSYPFCCERCQLIDLGQWLDGGYGIPGEPCGDIDPGDEA